MNGGRTNDFDRDRVGAEPTLANIGRRIEQLEELQRMRHEARAAEVKRLNELWSHHPVN